MDRADAATALSWLLGGIAVVLLDVRIERVDVLSDPVGYGIAAVGAWRLRRATPASWWSAALVALAPFAVLTSLLAEVGAVVNGTATGITASAGVPADAPPWIAAAAIATASLAAVGVLLLARHLRGVLDGVASDRWRQVTIAWVAFVVLAVLALVTAAIEVIVLAAAAGITAAAFVLLSLLATRRAFEDDEGAVHGR